MCLPARLFGPDGDEIVDLDSWFEHAPPEKGLAQWKDGFSAKEQAKAWLRSGRPQMPHELWSALSVLVPDADEVYGRPEQEARKMQPSSACAFRTRGLRWGLRPSTRCRSECPRIPTLNSGCRND